ncbi:MAG: ATP-binding cassette domain-containing protein [Candidatus Aerophobetes bacterium]|nr:ATP-binding cassette domain-containing protein [Candidatus Aerophobetes bacterium]
MLKINHLSKVFFKGSANENVALQEINLYVPRSDFVTIVGSNGAGKTTLLNVISGVFPPEEGKIEIDGQDVIKLPEYKRAPSIGRVFQDPLEGTAASLTIEENLAIASLKNKKRRLRLAITRKKRKEFRRKLKTLGLGLEDRLREKVSLLSGGQRQALTILMATLAEPELLLLDEHTASLDPKTAQKIIHLTKEIVARNSLTTLMVTHNMEEALKFGNRTIMMHEGRIILDISGKERAKMSVNDLLDKFSEVKKEKLVEDKMLLI